jgi:hypothetical protein
MLPAFLVDQQEGRRSHLHNGPGQMRRQPVNVTRLALKPFGPQGLDTATVGIRASEIPRLRIWCYEAGHARRFDLLMRRPTHLPGGMRIALDDRVDAHPWIPPLGLGPSDGNIGGQHGIDQRRIEALAIGGHPVISQPAVDAGR